MDTVAARAFEIAPLSPAVGARITGIDLSEPFGDDTAQQIYDAFAEHGVLCFPGQQISAQDQIRVASVLGKADADFRPPSVTVATTNKKRGVMLVTNIRKDGKQIGSLPDGEMHFHSDGAHRDVPYRATTLYGITIPSRGGDTLFANLAAAYEALPEATRARIDGREARHRYNYNAITREAFDENDSDVSEATHPLVRVHPDTGRRSLYLSRLMTRYIVGMDRAESDALLDELFDHAEKPEFVYAHKWTPGDLVMWDNRTVNHARTDFPPEETRLLRRYTVSEPK